MTNGMLKKKRVRLDALTQELAHLTGLDEVEHTVRYRDKAGRRRKRQETLPHSIRQQRRIDALTTDLIPQAQRRVGK